LTEDYPTWLRDNMQAAGYNARQLAERLGVSHQVVYQWLHGQCRPRREREVEIETVLWKATVEA